jgi:hypothetical protein
MNGLISHGVVMDATEIALDVVLTNTAVDENKAAAFVVGALSVTKGAGWVFSLTNTAGNMFAVSGSNLVVGATALNAATTPKPAITVRATSGAQVIERTFTMNVRKALPALPLTTNKRLGLVGHSQLHWFNVFAQTSDLGIGSDAKNVLAAYQCVDPRFDADSWWDATDPLGRNLRGANFALQGMHLELMDAQLTEAINHGAKAIILMGASNTISTGDTGVAAANAGYSIDYTEAMLQRCRNLGVPVILMTDYPRGSWIADAKLTPDLRKNTAIASYNDWVKAQVGREGVYVVDFWGLLAPGGVQDTSLFATDLTHLNSRGAWKAANYGPLATAMQAIFDSSEFFSTDPTTADQLLALANYNWAASGAINSGQVTGTKATALSFTVSPSAGSTIVCSMEQIGTTGRYKQVLDITPGNNGTGAAYHQATLQLPNSAITGLAAGDWVRHSLIVEVEGAAENLTLARVNNQISQVSTVKAQSFCMNTASPDFSIAPALPAGVRKIISPPLQIPVGAAFDRCRSFVALAWPRTAVGAFRVKLHSPKWAKITDPRIARGF